MLQATLDTGLGLLLPSDARDNQGLSRRERTLIQIACFLRRELPVRLARRAGSTMTLSNTILIEHSAARAVRRMTTCPTSCALREASHATQDEAEELSLHFHSTATALHAYFLR